MNTAILNKTLLNRIKNIVVALAAPILTFYLFEILTHNPFKTMKMPAQILNIVLFACAICTGNDTLNYTLIANKIKVF